MALRQTQLPPIQCVARALGIGFDKFIPVSRFHRGSIDLLKVVLIRFRLRCVAPSFDDTTTALFFVQILIDAHSWQVVTWPKDTLSHLGPLVKKSEGLKRFATLIQ